MMHTRRDFIKKGCLQCAAMLGAGVLLESCGSSMQIFKTQANDKKLVIPASEFLPDKTMIVVRSKDLENDILLIKKRISIMHYTCNAHTKGLV